MDTANGHSVGLRLVQRKQLTFSTSEAFFTWYCERPMQRALYGHLELILCTHTWDASVRCKLTGSRFLLGQ